MRKIIAIVMAAVLCLTLCGCGSSPRKENVKKLEAELGAYADETRTTTCALCRGSGTCSHCKGEAYRDGRRCSSCDGSGKCHYCLGEGKFTVVEIGGKDYTLCGSCHGSGACSMCSGSGRYTASFSTLGTIDDDCMLCRGSGKCLNCKGLGWKELRGF